MLRRLFAAAVMLLSVALDAHAFLSTEKALEWLDKGGQEAFAARTYIQGMAEAYWVVWVQGTSAGAPLICFPKDQNLRTDELGIMAVLSLRRMLNNMPPSMTPGFLDNPVSLSLFIAWKKDYPCR